MNETRYLKEGVEDTLMRVYGIEVLKLVNKKLAYGDYQYYTDDCGNQETTYVEVELDSWDDLPYLDYLKFFFELGDFEYDE